MPNLTSHPATPTRLTGPMADDLLKNTARSFSVTIRVLPRALRKPLTLAYLAARATDTVADSRSASREECRRILQEMPEDLRRTDPLAGAALRNLASAHKAEHAAEAQLLENWDALTTEIRTLDHLDRAEVQRVLETIVSGQLLDLERFGHDPDEPAEIVCSLQTAEELQDYTYRVAGCVGEFWSRLCVLHLPRYATLPAEEMERLGRSFGQGLQLVNILRDIVKDARNGRCYLPADELAEAGLCPSDLADMTEEKFGRLQEIRQRWGKLAAIRLEDGWRYTLANRYWRLRLGCALPALLGFGTLARLDRASPEEFAAGVKVPRPQTKRLIVQTALRSPSRKFLQNLRDNVR